MTRKFAGPDTAQLSLFDAVAVTASVGVPSAGSQAALAAPCEPAPPALPAVSIASVLTPAVFRHPQAEREIRLQEHLVAYALKRARRRSIGFIVGTEGLSVNAPKWVGVRDIETALHEKAGWILRKLREQQERQHRLQAAKVDWRDGASLPFLGETVIVVLDPRATGAVLNIDAAAVQANLASVPQLSLHVGLPHSAAPEQIRDAVQSWLQRQAKRVFEERCQHFSQQLGVRYTRLSLSSAQTRWGSATADGTIRLNWRLIHFAMPTIDYVVAHELAHLREMNHSPRFWDVVRSVVPDYEQARGTLKDQVLPVFD
jgi:predicted metal-dependent hydrolase